MCAMLGQGLYRVLSRPRQRELWDRRRGSFGSHHDGVWSSAKTGYRGGYLRVKVAWSRLVACKDFGGVQVRVTFVASGYQGSVGVGD